MTASNNSALAADWSEGSWRARAVRQLNWATLSVSLIPAIVGYFRGWAGGAIALAAAGVILVAALQGQKHARTRLAIIIAYWYSIALATMLNTGFAAPAMVLCLAIATSILGLFWGNRGLKIAITILPVLMSLAAWRLFFSGYGSFGFDDMQLLDLTPLNFLRQMAISILLISVLAFSISYTVRRLRESHELLQEETEQRLKAELALKEAQRSELVAQVTSGLAHNFGNALTVITTWSQLLERNPDNPRYAEKGLQQVSKAAGQAAAVARQIMTLGRTSPSNPELVDFASATESQLELIRSLLPANIEIRADLQLVPPVLIDHSELNQCIFNLLLNARDAVASEGVIEVRVLESGGLIILEVRDNGEGIEPEVRDRIFEPFFTTKGEDGTGLGLASVRQIVEDSNGQIELDTEVGVGTLFRLLFPAASVEEKITQHSAADTPSDNDPAVILVVDDNEMVRQVVEQGLELFGYQVISAFDTKSGIEQVHANNPIDLLFTDAIMPGGHLNELIDAYMTRFPGKPVLVYSGYLRDESLSDYLDKHSIEFLQKPAELETLRRKVSALLSSS